VIRHHRGLLGFLLASTVAAYAASAQTQSGADPVTQYSLTQGGAGASGAYLRMHQPLFVLDLVRQVRSGAMDRSTVAAIVGGTGILDGLLGIDLDALYATLTRPQDLRSRPASLWQQIVTKGGTSAPLMPDAPSDADLGDLVPGEARSHLVVVTAAADGTVQAALPFRSPFRILSMHAYDGQIVSAPPVDPAVGVPAAAGAVPADSSTFLMPATSRTRAPWTIAAQAGQDIAVEIGVPAAPSPGPGDVSSSINIGSVVGGWSRTIDLIAHVNPLPSIDGGMYIYLSQPLGTINVIRPPSYTPGVKIPFTLPLTLTCCFPSVDASGTISLTSGPAGVSMTPVNFSIGAGQTTVVPLTIEIDTLGPAWFAADYVGQPFTISLAYHSVPLAAAGTGSGKVQKTFTLYPGSKNWSSSGNAGPINCQEDVSLFSNGSIAISSTCGNYNIFPGKAIVDLFLGQSKVFSTAYGLNPYERQYASLSYNSATYQTNFLTWIAQAMISTRKGCLLCNF